VKICLWFLGYNLYWDRPDVSWTDNLFTFYVEVEISDHPLTSNSSTFPVTVGMQVGPIIMLGMK